MRAECPRGDDVLAALVSAAKGGAADPEVDRHVAGCEACRDLVVVANALREARDRARRSAHVPPAGLVWWKAERRRRQEAARVAAAPVAVVHGVSLAVLAAAACVGAALVVWGGWADALWVAAMSPASWTRLGAQIWASASPVRLSLALVGILWLVFAPVAVYFAVRPEDPARPSPRP